jgi:monofunctional biosynthetic peptidoglycan transglycosylase
MSGCRLPRLLFSLFNALIFAFVGVTAIGVSLLGRFPPPTTTFMLQSRFADPATGLACDEVAYRWVDGDDVARDLRLAVVLAEDQRFLLHTGFDVGSIRRAVVEHTRGRRTRGASTLTQQLAKNLFLWPGRSLLRKGLEVWFTIWIEWLWPKQRILEMYVNVAQFGPCVFGAEAASERFFDITAAELSPEQAALLAAVLPNPKQLRAHNPGPYAQERTAEILGLMQELRDASHLRGL